MDGFAMSSARVRPSSKLSLGLASAVRELLAVATPAGGAGAVQCRRYAWQDSNLRPLGPQPNALSPELQAHMQLRAMDIGPSAAGREGFEPSEEIKAPSTA